MLDCTANVRFNQDNMKQHSLLQMARKDADGTGGPMSYCALPGTLRIAGISQRTSTGVPGRPFWSHKPSSGATS